MAQSQRGINEVGAQHTRRIIGPTQSYWTAHCVFRRGYRGWMCWAAMVWSQCRGCRVPDDRTDPERGIPKPGTAVKSHLGTITTITAEQREKISASGEPYKKAKM